MQVRHCAITYIGKDIGTDGTDTSGVLPVKLNTEDFDLFDVSNGPASGDPRDPRVKGGYFFLEKGYYTGQEVKIYRGNTTDLSDDSFAHVFYYGWDDGEEKLLKISIPLGKKTNAIHVLTWSGSVWLKH